MRKRLLAILFVACMMIFGVMGLTACDGSSTPTTATSVQLTDGQSIVVKAVGDGTNYTDSDYSATQTYTAGTPAQTTAPTYLGILASAEAPSHSDIPSGIVRSSSLFSIITVPGITVEEALDNCLSDSNNSLGDTAPTESNYGVYSSVGDMVHIQIWLNNPDQNTILSLKLNGTKYQSGGALQSFFELSFLKMIYKKWEISYNENGYSKTKKSG